VDLKAGLDGCGKSRLHLDSIPGPAQIVPLRYTDLSQTAMQRPEMYESQLTAKWKSSNRLPSSETPKYKSGLLGNFKISLPF
jgi:hypothetical protein